MRAAYKAAFERVLVVMRYVLLQRLLSPVTWFVLGGGLLVANGLLFFVGGFLNGNDASLNLFWGFLPFVFAALMPLITMSGWAFEKQMGTAGWVSTKPIGPFWYDVGVFKSHVVLLLVWLAASLILPLTLGFLAQPHWPMVWAGYLGALLLGQLFLAIGFWVANASRTALGAFAGGFLGALALLFTAVEGVANLLPITLPAVVQNWVMALSPIHAYERFYTGFITLADVGWFMGLILAFFMWGHMARRRQIFTSSKKAVFTALALGSLFVGVLLHVFVPYSTDLTGQGQFKPTHSALKVVAEIPVEEINIEFYFSSRQASLPAPMRAFGRQVYGYLKTLEQRSDKINLRIIDPSHQPESELLAQKRGLTPNVAPDGSRHYLGLYIATPQTNVVMPALLLNRQHIFEFDLMNNIARLRHSQTRRIAVLTGLNMSDEKQRPSFLDMLTPFYRVDITNHENAMLPDENNLVIVFGGTFLKEQTLYALDQYVLRGGQVLVLVDPFWFTAPAPRLQTMGPDDGVTAKPGLDDLLSHWGMAYTPGHILADEALGSPVQITDSAAVTTHPLWLTLRSGEINQKHPLGQNLSKISLAAPGLFQLSEPQGLALMPLLSSSGGGHIFPRRFMYQAEIETINHFYEGEGQAYAIAAQAEGPFTPFYDERPPTAADWFAEEGKNWPKRFIADHTKTALKPGRVIAVADMDMFHPQLAAVGDSLHPANDNFNFLFNTVRHLLDEPEVLRMHLRPEASQRPFVRLERLLTALAQRLSQQETRLINTLMDVRADIAEKRNDMSIKRFENPLTLGEIHALSIKELETMHKIDALRQESFRRGRFAMSFIVGINVLGGFVLLVLAGVLFRRRHFKALNKQFKCS